MYIIMRIQSIAKLIRLPNEKWKHTLKRARKIKKYGLKLKSKIDTDIKDTLNLLKYLKR